jgi:hypothetical protein
MINKVKRHPHLKLNQAMPRAHIRDWPPAEEGANPLVWAASNQEPEKQVRKEPKKDAKKKNQSVSPND